MAREVTLVRDGEWLVLVFTRVKRGGEPKERRVYLSRDEAAIVVGLLVRESPEVSVSRADGGR